MPRILLIKLLIVAAIFYFVTPEIMENHALREANAKLQWGLETVILDWQAERKMRKECQMHESQ